MKQLSTIYFVVIGIWLFLVGFVLGGMYQDSKNNDKVAKIVRNVGGLACAEGVVQTIGFIVLKTRQTPPDCEQVGKMWEEVYK